MVLALAGDSTMTRGLGMTALILEEKGRSGMAGAPAVAHTVSCGWPGSDDAARPAGLARPLRAARRDLRWPGSPRRWHAAHPQPGVSPPGLPRSPERPERPAAGTIPASWPRFASSVHCRHLAGRFFGALLPYGPPAARRTLGRRPPAPGGADALAADVGRRPSPRGRRGPAHGG